MPYKHLNIWSVYILGNKKRRNEVSLYSKMMPKTDFNSIHL